MYTPDAQQALDRFLQRLGLLDDQKRSGPDKMAKVGQILAYLEIIRAQLKKYSPRRHLVCVESGAGNCYLSFLTYYYFTHVERRPITIHCVDTNDRLMSKAAAFARDLQFEHMHFHARDIADFSASGRIDLVYSLHACDAATDKALHLGLRQGAPCILAVACCQHQIRQQLSGHPFTGITRHRVFKDRFVYMIGDALRAMLLEMQGYKVDIVEFTSSRHTDKNTMIRARKGHHVADPESLRAEYARLRDAFRVSPSLERYLGESPRAEREEARA